MDVLIVVIQGALTLIGIGLTGFFSTRSAQINSNARQKQTEQLLTDKIEILQRDQSDIKKRLDELSETDSCCATLQKDVINLKRENRITMRAMMACLDGLQQLGANHDVPLARDELNSWLNETAHE